MIKPNHSEIIDVVVSWSKSAKRGEKTRLAKKIGWSTQQLTNTISRARAGVVSQNVEHLYHVLTKLHSKTEIDKIVVGGSHPTRIQDLTMKLVAKGFDFDVAQEYLRSNFPLIRNIFDRNEYVFAEIKEDEDADATVVG